MSTTVYHTPLPWAAPLDSWAINRSCGKLDAQIVRVLDGTFDYIDRTTAPLLPQTDNYHLYIYNGELHLQSTGSDVTFGHVIAYACLQDLKSSGTNGGTFTSGSPQTRDITTIQADDSGFVTLSSNQIGLAAGTYRIYAAVPAFFVFDHQATLYNVTSAEVLLYGTVEYATGTALTHSIVCGTFTLSEPSVVKVQHECNTTRATDGFGLATGWGNEIYTQIELWALE